MAKMKKGRVIYSHMITQNDDELQLEFNNVVDLEDEEPEAGKGWYYATYKGKRGIVPKNYIENIDFQGIDALVLCDYSSEQKNGQYLEITKGETILLLSYDSSGWSVAYKDSQIGAVPHSYLQIINPTTVEEVRQLFFEKEDELPLIQILCWAIDTACCEAFAKDLTLLFEHHNLTFKLLRSIIQDEVDKTKDESTLFRKNNLCSHIMTSYARFIGKNYVKETLSPLIHHIASSKQSCEIDPHKGNIEEIDENMKNLRQLCQMFFHRIMESISKVPIALKQTCELLRQIVVARFPKSKRRVVGGFYFLRFICPAVVSPEGFGVIDKIDMKTRRSLILISKIIQTLSNGLEFGQKEVYMIPMNEFIKENLENAHYVLDKLSTTNFSDTQPPIERLPALSDEEYEALTHRLHHHLYSSINKVVAEALDLNYPPEYADRIHSVVLRAGPPHCLKYVEPSPPQPSPAEPSPLPSPLPSPSPSPLPSPSLSPLSPIDSPSHSSKVDEKKKHREKENEKTRKVKDIKKSKEKEFTSEGDILVEGFLLKKLKGKIGTAVWAKRYYAIYSNSTKLYYSNNPEDLRDGRFQGHIELYPSYNLSKLGKCKNPPGWEIRLLTADTHEYHFICPSFDELTLWTTALEQRLTDQLLPAQALKRKDDALASLQSSIQRCASDLEILKARVENAMNDDDRAKEQKQLVKLTEKYSELSGNIEKAKRDREQLIAISKPNI